MESLWANAKGADKLSELSSLEFILLGDLNWPFKNSPSLKNGDQKFTEKLMVRTKERGDPRSLDFPHDASDEFCFLYVGQSFDFDTDDRLFS